MLRERTLQGVQVEPQLLAQVGLPHNCRLLVHQLGHALADIGESERAQPRAARRIEILGSGKIELLGCIDDVLCI